MVEKEENGIGGGIGQSPDGQGHVTFYVSPDPAGDARQGGAARRARGVAHDRAAAGHDPLFADPEGHVVGLAKGM